MDKDKDKEWDQLPDYLEAVRRERRPGDPTEYGMLKTPPIAYIDID